MAWYSRHCTNEEWGRYQNLFEEVFVALGGPRSMMLVSATHDRPPDATLYAFFLLERPSAFDGFEPIDIPPSVASLQVGQDEFERQFGYPER